MSEATSNPFALVDSQVRKHLEGKIILLDLVATIMEPVARAPGVTMRDHVRHHEGYRAWVRDLIVHTTVILMTARRDYYRNESLLRMQEVLGWTPAHAFFATFEGEPPVTKGANLVKQVFPRFGTDRWQYIALESNIKTRGMYKTHGIEAHDVHFLTGRPRPKYIAPPPPHARAAAPVAKPAKPPTADPQGSLL